MPDGSPVPTAATAAAADARTRILDAAEAVVIARGVAGLTLEGAAREAGVSKGGLLYHFATKDALVSAMLDRLAGFVAAEFEAGIAAQPPGPHRVARAMLAWVLDQPPEAICARYDRAAAVFLSAQHADPALLDPMRALFRGMKARLLADGTPPGPALAILAAGDGLFWASVFGTWEASAEERAALRATLAGLLAR